MAQSARDIAVVILAAGQGTRMKSARAKVLHELCGRPMLGHVLSEAEALAPSRLLVVVGRDADDDRATLPLLARGLRRKAPHLTTGSQGAAPDHGRDRGDGVEDRLPDRHAVPERASELLGPKQKIDWAGPDYAS